MNQNSFERMRPSRLARLPPVTLRWLPGIRRKNRTRGSAPARQEGSPPTFTIASPSQGEGEAMVKAGGREKEFLIP
jgi:hypothetical protein